LLRPQWGEITANGLLGANPINASQTRLPSGQKTTPTHARTKALEGGGGGESSKGGGSRVKGLCRKIHRRGVGGMVCGD